MLEKEEIARFLGQDTEKMSVGASKENSFKGWLLMNKGMGNKWASMVESFANRLLRKHNCPFPTKKDAETIALSIWSSDCSKSHQRHQLIALEYYMEYCGAPVKFKKPRATKRNPKYLTQVQMKALIRAARDFREFAMLMVFCTTGMRLNEFCMLNYRDIDLKGRKVTIRHAKRDKDREVPLSEECCKVVAAYIDKYHQNPKPNDPMFLSARGNRWSQHAVEAIVKRCGERAGIKEKVTPHILRHSFATAMLGNGCDLFHLSHILGHSEISTTTIYLHVNDKAMREAYNKGVPRL